ncbi:hypothetical protein FB45DRAFT_1061969 [Roridomyces roridus]|uniref:Uncharacterized protein n=1 Tax=Roridomyces roridus TaxID=1738132 RepID=A0AAD7BJ68_9AGAR|nr:hypothetical protein FB45DRAFT_1061969 [Roridomyces roridus]
MFPRSLKRLSSLSQRSSMSAGAQLEPAAMSPCRSIDSWASTHSTVAHSPLKKRRNGRITRIILGSLSGLLVAPIPSAFLAAVPGMAH